MNSDSKITHVQACEILNLKNKLYINNLISQGKLKRAGFGKVWKNSVLQYRDRKKDRAKISKGQYKELLLEVEELKLKLKVLEDIYDINQIPLNLDYHQLRAIIGAAKELDFNEKGSLESWAELTLRLDVNTLDQMQEINKKSWLYIYRVCLCGQEIAKSKGLDQLYLKYIMARKNIHDLSLLITRVEQNPYVHQKTWENIEIIS